jgi:hypothetical protein
MVVLSCRLMSCRSFPLTGLAFRLVVRSGSSIFLACECTLRGRLSAFQSYASEYIAAGDIR